MKEKFLSKVFYKIHHQYLRTYTYPELFSSIFNEGKYNCVTGTALYSWFLTRLGYQHSIYQLTTHVYLIITLSDSSTILMESTDPVNGFVADENQIRKRVADYIADDAKTIPNNYQRVSPTVISLKQLAGLQYFNKAVELINKPNYFEGLQLLKKASILFPESFQIDLLLELARARHEAELNAMTANQRQN